MGIASVAIVAGVGIFLLLRKSSIFLRGRQSIRIREKSWLDE